MISKLKLLCFLLTSWSAILAEKEGVAVLQSTVHDVEHCDWLLDIQTNKFVESDDSNHRSRKVQSAGLVGGSERVNQLNSW